MPRRKAEPLKRPITSWEKAPLIMDTEYAALLLGLYPDTLKRMARNGEVPVKRFGKKLWKFEKSALMAWAGVKE